MVRARQTKILLALVVLAGGAGRSASAAPNAVAVAAPSPSAVMAQLCNKTGNVGYAWSRQQESRPDKD